MKVGELVQHLSSLPHDARVIVDQEDCPCCVGMIEDISKVELNSKKNIQAPAAYLLPEDNIVTIWLGYKRGVENA